MALRVVLHYAIAFWEAGSTGGAFCGVVHALLACSASALVRYGPAALVLQAFPRLIRRPVRAGLADLVPQRDLALQHTTAGALP